MLLFCGQITWAFKLEFLVIFNLYPSPLFFPHLHLALASTWQRTLHISKTKVMAVDIVLFHLSVSATDNSVLSISKTVNTF